MVNLDVFNIEFLEITELPMSDEFAPGVGPKLGWVLLIDQLLQGLHQSVVCWIKKERN